MRMSVVTQDGPNNQIESKPAIEAKVMASEAKKTQIVSTCVQVVESEANGEGRKTPKVLPPPLFGHALLCRSSCSSFCEPGLDQVPDQTAVAFCESQFVCQAGLQQYADTVMACQISCGC